MHFLFDDHYKNFYNLSRDEILLYIIRKKQLTHDGHFWASWFNSCVL